jgi:hypothetical protein
MTTHFEYCRAPFLNPADVTMIARSALPLDLPEIWLKRETLNLAEQRQHTFAPPFPL